ncbi:MAG: CinA family protein [Clostridia bacterium]|nr:CinA family protein [Clostridia bacterium]
MQIKVVIFAEEQAIVSKEYETLEIDFLQRGIFDAQITTTSTFEECISICKDSKNSIEQTILVCKNDMINNFVERLKDNDDVLSLIKDQAVKLERKTTFGKMFFIPIEVNFGSILDEILPRKEVHKCSIFGKNKRFVEDAFESFKVKYAMISKSSFLHIVFYSGTVSEQNLISVFGENLYCQEERSLSLCCQDLMNKKGLSLSVAEGVSMGGLCAKFCKEKAYQNLKNCLVLTNEQTFNKVGLNKEFLDEYGVVSKETVFAVAKNLLKNEQTDLVLSVLGFDCDAGRSYVAVGNKDEIHVFSSVFYGNRESVVENLTDFALFRLFNFLKEKC